MTATESKLDRIAKHGNQLLAIFPNATERNPVKLCKKLRRLEAQASRHTLELCNGDEPGPHDEAWSDRHNEALFLILNKVHVLLGNTTQNKGTVPVFINRDPRGYALKIDDEWMREHNAELHRDWGGYGILAPEID